MPSPESSVQQVDFEAGVMKITDVMDRTWELDSQSPTFEELSGKRSELENYFNSKSGFDSVTCINYIDGIRITFANGDIIHMRPSGNAPQFRVYSNANSKERANEIVRLCLSEPGGIMCLPECALSCWC